MMRAIDEIYGWFGRGSGPKGVIAWNKSRIWINVSKYSRSTFSIHGRYFPGSPGCIYLVKQISVAINEIQNAAFQTRQTKVPLIVNYKDEEIHGNSWFYKAVMDGHIIFMPHQPN